MAAEHHDTFHHVRDAAYFETSETLGLGVRFVNAHGEEVFGIPLPEIFGFQITKFMVLQLVAGIFVLLVFRGLAKRLAGGQPTKGRWWNFWESLALFIRDEVVRPTIGTHHNHHGHGPHDQGDGDGAAVGGVAEDVGDTELSRLVEAGEVHGEPPTVAHPADRYLPFIWTLFFYILVCNLLGAIPWMGSATGSINVTGALALMTVAYVIWCGSRISGPVGFWLSLAPGMELHPAMKVVLVPVIWVIELLGFVIKHGVLAVRLFANIMAGHTVLAVILTFIAATAGSGLWYAVLPASIFGQVAIGLLELFVAFLQAYVFAFLATLFVSAAIHPH